MGSYDVNVGRPSGHTGIRLTTLSSFSYEVNRCGPDSVDMVDRALIISPWTLVRPVNFGGAATTAEGNQGTLRFLKKGGQKWRQRSYPI